jgi:RNA polymerase sigma factor (sigma-70 family)
MSRIPASRPTDTALMTSVQAGRRAALGELYERLALRADYVAHAEHEQLAELLARLPPGQREIIQLGFFDGLTHQQIAHRLALPPGTVKGRMRLGLKKLHDNLDHQRPSI